VFCNFDGCYSKRGDREVSDLVDSVGLLRRLQDVAENHRSDDVRTQKSAITLESDDDRSTLYDQRRGQWMTACCPAVTLAKIRR